MTDEFKWEDHELCLFCNKSPNPEECPPEYQMQVVMNKTCPFPEKCPPEYRRHRKMIDRFKWEDHKPCISCKCPFPEKCPPEYQMQVIMTKECPGRTPLFGPHFGDKDNAKR